MSRYGDPVIDDEAAYDRRCEASRQRYLEREKDAPADIYEDEARDMIIEALTGGKDELDVTGHLIERFKKDCGSVSALGLAGGAKAPNMLIASPEHLARLVEWTVKARIKHWVDYRTKEYAEGRA